LPIWTHSTVDSENATSNMSFASFIRTYNFTLASKSALFALAPGTAALNYKSSIIFEQVRSHVGFTEPAAVAGAAEPTVNADHVNLLHQNVISENEVIIPALVSGSTITGGDISKLNITSSQVYLSHTVRPVIEHQSSLSIYHLPDMHVHNLPTSGSTFSINSNDNRWVSKFLMLMPYTEYNRSYSNPDYHQTWHRSGYSEINYVPKRLTFDVPQNQVQHFSSLFDSTPVVSGTDIPMAPTYTNITSVATQMGSAGLTGYTESYIQDRYEYQSPIRKQLVSGWSKLFIERPLVTKIGLRVQSFSIYDEEKPYVAARSTFFYDNAGISPRDKQILILKLCISPFDDSTNSGGLNLSKYRDVIIHGTLNTTTVSDLNTATSNTSAAMVSCSYGYNVLITTQRAQFRRFAN
ncbi:MAG: hypothetical protein KDH96_07295, partial [Candidatus Riesia sp.]|nr:hypothetical protein [Candidatus Riesia sp.]